MTKAVREKPNFIAGAQIDGVELEPEKFNTLLAINNVKMLRYLDAFNGKYIITGCDITPSATAGKLDITTGYQSRVVNNVFTPRKVAAVTAIATKSISDIASDASLATGQAVWVSLELDSSGVVVFNRGTTATAEEAQIPDVTAGNVGRSILYVPYGATTVSQSTSGTADAKLFDVAVVQANTKDTTIDHISGTNVTNTTTLTPLFDSHNDHFPADSLRNGDVITIHAVMYMTNATGGSSTTVENKGIFGGATIWDITSSAAIASAGSGISSNISRYFVDITIYIASSIQARVSWDWCRMATAASNAGEQAIAERSRHQGLLTIDTTAAINFEIQQRNATSSANAVHALFLASITKKSTL